MPDERIYYFPDNFKMFIGDISEYQRDHFASPSVCIIALSWLVPTLITAVSRSLDFN
jgi:hypothetical protein